MVQTRATEPYQLVPRDLGAEVDVTNIGELLGMMDEAEDGVSTLC